MESKSTISPILFYSAIDIESIEGLMRNLKEYQDKSACNPTKIKIYMSTPGGDISLSEAVADYINNIFAEGMNIEIVCVGQISSAGLVMLLELDCPVRLLSPSFAIFHLATRDLDYRDQLSLFSSTNYKKDMLEYYNNKMLNKLKDLGVNKDRLERVERGEDILFNIEELKQLLKNKGEK